MLFPLLMSQNLSWQLTGECIAKMQIKVLWKLCRDILDSLGGPFKSTHVTSVY